MQKILYVRVVQTFEIARQSRERLVGAKYLFWTVGVTTVQVGKLHRPRIDYLEGSYADNYTSNAIAPCVHYPINSAL